VSPLAALAAALLAGASPFVAEQPRVKEGNERLLSGDAAGALERYDAAEQEAGPRPEIDFDRGDALHALGRHAEAREAWKRALERDRAGALSSRALQNMGNALDAEGDQEGAARALAEALRRDPANEDARYNLEVLLRRKAAGKGKPKDEGQDGAERQQGPPEQGQGQQPGPDQRRPQDRQGQPQEQGQDERRHAGDEQRREQGKQGAEPRAGEHQPGRDAGHAGARPDAIGRQDAEKLLDAMRSRERNMPLGPAGRKDARQREVGRDW
jgi:Ca-activated chloride channel family protein